jgi:protein ImuA
MTAQEFAEIRRRFQQAPLRAGGCAVLGIPEIDRALPWEGLPRGCLHEIAGSANDAAAAGFTIWLTSLLCARGGWALWCRSEQRSEAAGQVYGPALAQFGMDMERVLFVTTQTTKDLLWAMEEGLRARRFASVIGDGVTPDLIQTRRLQLAAETGGATALLLLPPQTRSAPTRISAAMTRWAVHACVADSPLRHRWQLQLERCRGGAHGLWQVEWNDEALRLDLSSPLADGLLAAAE